MSMSTEEKKAAPEGDVPELTQEEARDEPEQDAGRDAGMRVAESMSVHDRVVIVLALAVALVLCIIFGTTLRVPGD